MTDSKTKSDERKKIRRERQEEKQKREKDEERFRHLSFIGEKIRREELSESERKRFRVELTSIPS
jgi:hypothetical protein